MLFIIGKKYKRYPQMRSRNFNIDWDKSIRIVIGLFGYSGCVVVGVAIVITIGTTLTMKRRKTGSGLNFHVR